MKLIRNILLIVITFATAGCRNSETTTKSISHSGKIERTYVAPKRIVWQTPGESVRNSTVLLKNDQHQASIYCTEMCVMKNDKEQASILLDFGKELHGGIEIITGMTQNNKPIPVRIRFGESVSEAMAELNEQTGATNDHAIRDWKIDLPYLGKLEIGNTGFRFVKIDLMDNDRELLLQEVNAISVMRDIPYLGSFKSNDERLNKIWETGAYTVQLNMQEYLWDGIKRDRLVWVGDMHPEVMTILSVFGANNVVPKSLDYIAQNTPNDQWVNGISSYSMWWVLIQYQYYMNTGDLASLNKNIDFFYLTMDKLESKIDENGKEILDGWRFLDWPTSEDPAAISVGLQSMMLTTFNAGKAIAQYLGDNDKVQHFEEIVKKLSAHVPEIPKRKSPGALMALAGYGDPKKINDELLVKDGVRDLSTFYGYYVLNAMARAENYQQAQDFIREYWGGMLDLGATTFWEDFNTDWLINAGRIDEMPTKDKVDVHSTYGGYCYKKLRHSFCHGWASGPTAWLSEYVLGVQILKPGCKKVKIEPHLGNLEWVEGTYPTPLGVIKIRHEKRSDGTISSAIMAPEGIVVVD